MRATQSSETPERAHCRRRVRPEEARPWAVVAFLLAAVTLAGPVFAGGMERTPAPPDARAYIISPSDGEPVKSPFKVRFGLSGMGVAPAGVEKPGTGHHHLLIDVPLPAFDKPVPADDNHMHFGGGQTEVTLELAPGTHTLQLILGDHLHVPLDPPVVSEKITVVVVE